MLDRPPSRRTRRARWQADYRQRQRNGEAVAPVPYGGAVVDFLISTKWLDQGQAADRHAVGAAIGRLMQDTAKRNRDA
jgi:hypothetical protein